VVLVVLLNATLEKSQFILLIVIVLRVLLCTRKLCRLVLVKRRLQTNQPNHQFTSIIGSRQQGGLAVMAWDWASISGITG